VLVAVEAVLTEVEVLCLMAEPVVAEAEATVEMVLLEPLTPAVVEAVVDKIHQEMSLVMALLEVLV
jgi:hypothetical protein